MRKGEGDCSDVIATPPAAAYDRRTALSTDLQVTVVVRCEQHLTSPRSSVAWVEAPGLCCRSIPAVVTTAVGQMHLAELFWIEDKRLVFNDISGDGIQTLWDKAISREGKEGKHKMFRGSLWQIYALRNESDSAVGAGLDVPALQSGIMPLFEVFKLAVSSFKVNDWSLFGGDAA
ncbi:hypothetical protein EZV62_023417 [Acer yangbiense]|uniref:Uncharacterized protein n=1 Tax=Acer yangbiense TaxID=1000413 RepID=A0A5C7H1Q6_9ROSI|nr:hypothetical protein EZV62_023417 [Acer yangbiense]